MVKSDTDYLHVYTGEKRYVILHTLKDMQEKLAPHGFIKVHKSYLVDKNKVDEVDKENHVLKIGDREAPYSRRLKKEIFSQLNLS